jgi:hypothetical protein
MPQVMVIVYTACSSHEFYVFFVSMLRVIIGIDLRC